MCSLSESDMGLGKERKRRWEVDEMKRSCASGKLRKADSKKVKWEDEVKGQAERSKNIVFHTVLEIPVRYSEKKMSLLWRTTTLLPVC